MISLAHHLLLLLFLNVLSRFLLIDALIIIIVLHLILLGDDRLSAAFAAEAHLRSLILQLHNIISVFVVDDNIIGEGLVVGRLALVRLPLCYRLH